MDVAVRGITGKKEEKLVRKLRGRDVSVTGQPGLPPSGAGHAGACPAACCYRHGTGRTILRAFAGKEGIPAILLERGEDVDARTRRVAEFWENGGLCPDSNVQFGKAGQEHFQMGKLNTLVKDPSGRNKEVLRILVEFGADPSILYVNKPPYRHGCAEPDCKGHA